VALTNADLGASVVTHKAAASLGVTLGPTLAALATLAILCGGCGIQ